MKKDRLVRDPVAIGQGKQNCRHLKTIFVHAERIDLVDYVMVSIFTKCEGLELGKFCLETVVAIRLALHA